MMARLFGYLYKTQNVFKQQKRRTDTKPAGIIFEEPFTAPKIFIIKLIQNLILIKNDKDILKMSNRFSL